MAVPHRRALSLQVADEVAHAVMNMAANAKPATYWPLETYWPHVGARERCRSPRNVHFHGGDECWIWLGAIESDGGYARFRNETLVIEAQRWSAPAHHDARRAGGAAVLHRLHELDTTSRNTTPQ